MAIDFQISNSLSFFSFSLQLKSSPYAIKKQREWNCELVKLYAPEAAV